VVVIKQPALSVLCTIASAIKVKVIIFIMGIDSVLQMVFLVVSEFTITSLFDYNCISSRVKVVVASIIVVVNKVKA